MINVECLVQNCVQEYTHCQYCSITPSELHEWLKVQNNSKVTSETITK